MRRGKQLTGLDLLERQVRSVVEMCGQGPERIRHRSRSRPRAKACRDAFKRRVVEPEDEVAIGGVRLGSMSRMDAVGLFEVRSPSAVRDFGSAVPTNIGESVVPQTVTLAGLVVWPSENGPTTPEPFDEAEWRGLRRGGVDHFDECAIPPWRRIRQVEGEKGSSLGLQHVRKRSANVPAQAKVYGLDSLLRLASREHEQILEASQPKLTDKSWPILASQPIPQDRLRNCQQTSSAGTRSSSSQAMR